MGKKKPVTRRTILLLILLAFNSFAVDTDLTEREEYLYRYISREQVEISLGQTLTQTMTYVEFNGNLDYWLTAFMNPKNEKIVMHTGLYIEDVFTKGEQVKVVWEIVTLSEAGLGEVPYYFWSLVEMEKIDR